MLNQFPGVGAPNVPIEKSIPCTSIAEAKEVLIRELQRNYENGDNIFLPVPTLDMAVKAIAAVPLALFED
jgi:hypothetical protein